MSPVGNKPSAQSSDVTRGRQIVMLNARNVTHRRQFIGSSDGP
jgi:hypothetical protein